MGSPRTKYRLACIVVPLSVVLAVGAALQGLWLVLACVALVGLGTLFNLREMRRRGIDWDGPTTYRELRQRQTRVD